MDCTFRALTTLATSLGTLNENSRGVQGLEMTISRDGVRALVMWLFIAWGLLVFVGLLGSVQPTLIPDSWDAPLATTGMLPLAAAYWLGLGLPYSATLLWFVPLDFLQFVSLRAIALNDAESFAIALLFTLAGFAIAGSRRFMNWWLRLSAAIMPR